MAISQDRQGEGYEHRKQWIEDRLELLAHCFAMSVCGFAVMDNHLHVLVRLDPDAARDLADEEVVRRWSRVYPPKTRTGEAIEVNQAWIDHQLKDEKKVTLMRERLTSLGWFMKALKEPLARLATFLIHFCARRDPESKGTVEAKVRYVKRNALQGRDEELTCWEDYGRLAVYWRDEVANVRTHQTTKERPVDRLEKERNLLRPLPTALFDTDEVHSAVVNSHARVQFDGNRYSTRPELARQVAIIRASGTHVRAIYRGEQVACHARCYDRGQLVLEPRHHLEALK